MILVVAAQLFVIVAYLLFVWSQPEQDPTCEALECLIGPRLGWELVGLGVVLPMLIISTLVALVVLARWGGQSTDRLSPAFGLATLFGCWVLAACGWIPALMLLDGY